MSNTPGGLPLTSSRVEQIFPILTPAQINRIAVHGHMRAIQPGQVLVEQGDSTVPFFVVVSGELEIVRPSCADETVQRQILMVIYKQTRSHKSRPSEKEMNSKVFELNKLLSELDGQGGYFINFISTKGIQAGII